MSAIERRTTERQAVTFSVILATDGAVLSGQALNASHRGLLLLARGNISARVSVKGKNYLGRLVRASAVGPDTIAYAVELLEDVADDAWAAA